MASRNTVETRFFIISDTHGRELPPHYLPHDKADVAIHCGDLTEESKLEEFRQTIGMLRTIDAPLKLVIAGNHDFTLDTPMFKKKISEIYPPAEPALVKREYGDFEEARQLLEEAKSDSITFLDEGTHYFDLENGARLKVYASPFTPSTNDWGFQYAPQEGHEWSIDDDTDVVTTHGPPKGIFDFSDSKRLGCPALFEAIAKARPRLHCFGHIHQGWGAKLVSWRPHAPEGTISHFTAIDNGNSTLIESLPGITESRTDTPQLAEEKSKKRDEYYSHGQIFTSHCSDDAEPLQANEQTLFVNAAIQGTPELQLPWIVDIELPMAY